MSAAVPTPPLPGTSFMQMYISCYTVNNITTVIIIIISIIIILFIYLFIYLCLFKFFIGISY
jgi:hypothetical protein